MTPADHAVERAGRWMASRMSRRSFLGRLAQVAVLVAGGPTLATLLVRRAEARVCGQSGVSPRCPTYDCNYPNSVWGWCWYASPGCCAGGGLKKICDCCTTAWPNVHGYCPSGTNVRCIVESCFADPRVMPVPVVRVDSGDAAGASLAVSRLRFGSRRTGRVVVGDAQDGAAAALAASVAGALGAPLLLTHRDRLLSGVIDELQRLGATDVKLVGPGLGPGIQAALDRYATVERIGTGGTLEAQSLVVARWVIARTGARRALAVARAGVAGSVAGAVGAAAAARRYPVVVGVQAAKALATGPGPRPVLTYMVGPELARRSGEIPGAHPLSSGSTASLSRELASVMVRVEKVIGTVALVPLGQSRVAAGLANPGGVVLFHAPGSLDPATNTWIRDHQPAIARAYAAGSAGAVTSQGVHDLQSALNHFDAHRLIGVSGQGLPVISQPLHERDIGRARVAGALPADEGGAYWISRANPGR